MRCIDLLKYLTEFSYLDVNLVEGKFFIYESNECIYDSCDLESIIKFLLRYIADNLEGIY